MPLDYERIMALPAIVSDQGVTAKDTILYALSVGADDLALVYEKGLVALPTMATVMAYPGFFEKEPAYGLAWQHLLHGEQSVELHCALPATGRFRATTSIEEIHDWGPQRGALILSTRVIHNRDSGELIATLRSSSIARADGGFGQRTHAAAPRPHKTPVDRAPDLVVHAATRHDQALLYRLLGDDNPLHIDPAIASTVGYDRPILHGLCTYGVVGRLLLESCCNRDYTDFKRLDARFSAPVFPGDTIRVEVWRESTTTWAFQALVDERNAMVISNGLFVSSTAKT